MAGGWEGGRVEPLPSFAVMLEVPQASGASGHVPLLGSRTYPSARTAVSPMTASRMVPYRTCNIRRHMKGAL